MFFNYLKIALRNLWRNKIFSFINLAGLSVGLAACFMIFKYTFFEMSYDRFHSKSENIYRVVSTENLVVVPPAVGISLQEYFSEVKEMGRITREKAVVRKNAGEQENMQESVYYVDKAIFNIFDFEFTRGQATKLSKPNQVVISQSYAQKFFGRSNPVGKTLTIQDQFGEHICTVQGVFQDLPRNSHFHLNIVGSLATIANNDIPWADLNGWTWGSFYTYILLNEESKPKELQNQINQLAVKMGSENAPQFRLQALNSIHLHSNLNNELEKNGNGQVVNMLLVIGILILIIAWINYINLATARSLERAKEVGIRKVVGAHRPQLIRQFLLEAFLLNTFALLLAILTQDMLNPLLEWIVGYTITFSWQNSVGLVATILAVFIVGSFISGLYPAFILSAYHPVRVLQGTFKTSRQGVGLRQALVVSQFIASLLLISGTCAVYYQLDYMRTKNLGMNINQTLIISNRTYGNPSSNKVFMEQIRQLSNIEKAATSANVPGVGYNWGGAYLKPKNDNSDQTYPTNNYYVDGDFIDFYEMTLVAGKDGKEFLQTDRSTRGVLMNEAAAQSFGFHDPSQAIGQKMKDDQDQIWEIVGIVKDYHHESLKKKIEPVLFLLDKYRSVFSLKIKVQDNPQKVIQETLAETERLFEELFPEAPFNYYFLDEVFNQKYQDDQRFGSLFGVFSLLAIFIACLGLFGLASFSTLQRTKEIGIRKVMGASSRSILVLLTREYMWLIIIASLLAWPLAYWGTQAWLNNYAYRPSLHFLLFLIPIFIVAAIALLTVSYQTLKTARANPIKALRDE